jgi:polar amino acid transport system substrate-binding protein
MRKKLKVAIASMHPFIIPMKNKYTGFEVELWEMIAKEMKVAFSYELRDFQELIPLVKQKKADIAFASITINEAREEYVDFSHPTFNSGLKILLSKNRKNIDFVNTIKIFFIQSYRQLLKPLLLLFLFIFILGNVLFFLEKNHHSISSAYIPGVLQTTWIYTASMLGLDGGFFIYTVNSWVGRILMASGQIFALAFFGLLIGELTAFITTKKIRLNIHEPNDLKDKIVATVKETTSEATLKNLGAQIVPVIKIDEAFELLKRNKVEAVVFDSPMLTYYASHDGANFVETIGDLFEKQDYGFVMQNDSSLRKQVNLALLSLRENGSYDTLYKKWFG